jgi:hypothetical protein
MRVENRSLFTILLQEEGCESDEKGNQADIIDEFFDITGGQ